DFSHLCEFAALSAAIARPWLFAHLGNADTSARQHSRNADGASSISEHKNGAPFERARNVIFAANWRQGSLRLSTEVCKGTLWLLGTSIICRRDGLLLQAGMTKPSSMGLALGATEHFIQQANPLAPPHFRAVGEMRQSAKQPTPAAPGSTRRVSDR